MAKLTTFGAADVSIELHSDYSAVQYTSLMPRGDDCHTCASPANTHPNGKCLFEASQLQPISRDEFTKRFRAWVAGQKLEEALGNIVYELTRRD